MPTSAETPPIQPLPQTPARAATPALQGYDYQVWISLDKWMSLPEHGILFLEEAEDIDLVSEGEANTIQVWRTSESISLNTKKARTAIKQFWVTRERELSGIGREVRYT